MNTDLLLYLVLFVAPISNLIHELGHMIGAMLVKADKITIILGRGKQVFKLYFEHVDIQLGWLFFTAGLTISNRSVPYKSSEMVCITLWGPLLNAIIVFISYLIYQSIPNTYTLVFMLYNGWLFIINCIPFKIGKQESDGYIIIREIVKKMYTS
jgi:Zn-dependent protease